MKPPQLGWGDLVWSHFSRPRFDPIPARIAAASAAGFQGIGLYAHAYGKWLDEGGTSSQLRDLLSESNLVLAEIEAMRGWWADSGPHAEEAQAVERWAFELASTVGARYLQVIGPYECDVDTAIHRFGSLCDRAAEVGLLVGIEWLPFTNITTPADAQRIVETADRPNGGYCVDILHHMRGTAKLSDVLALDPAQIFAIQLNDGTLQPVDSDYKRDCLANRLLPGLGEFECAAFVSALRAHGVQAPLSAEVCSPMMWESPVQWTADQCAAALRSVLAG
jgi:sugar phosphate isomerase/epimerase